MKTFGPALAAASLLLAGCSTVKVDYDYDREFDFSTLETFGWLDVAPNPTVNPLALKRARSAVRRELEAKGYSLSESGADFLVAIHGLVRQKTQVIDHSDSYRWRYHGAGYVSVHTYEEGTLYLDCIKGGTKELFWRGSASATIGRADTPEERERRINDAVARILEGFPPEP